MKRLSSLFEAGGYFTPSRKHNSSIWPRESGKEVTVFDDEKEMEPDLLELLRRHINYNNYSFNETVIEINKDDSPKLYKDFKKWYSKQKDFRLILRDELASQPPLDDRYLLENDGYWNVFEHKENHAIRFMSVDDHTENDRMFFFIHQDAWELYFKDIFPAYSK